MKKETVKIKIPRSKHRALELYITGTPFKQKVEKDQTTYSRKKKHRKVLAEE